MPPKVTAPALSRKERLVSSHVSGPVLSEAGQTSAVRMRPYATTSMTMVAASERVPVRVRLTVKNGPSDVVVLFIVGSIR